MRALRLLVPTRASLSYPWPRASRLPPAITRSVVLPSRLPRAPITLAFSRPFTQTSRRPNNWRDPRRQPPRDPHEELSRARPLIASKGISRTLRSPSFHTVIVLAVGGATVFYFWNIETVPVSGRRRFNCFDEEMVEKATDAQVKHLEWEVERQGGHFLSDADPRTRMVKRVLTRLIPYSGMADADWEVRIIEDPKTANAFVLPGGKVFVFSGLIPIARNEHGLAAVLGHEIAHNLAQHVGERMSSQIGINILLYTTIFLTGGLVMPLFGGNILDLLLSKPMGRRQESEADYIGLMMMAEACYDPREAFYFWQRMERMHEGNEPPEWLSTHPSNNNRMEKIKEWMPKAIEARQNSDCQGNSIFADRFRRAMREGFTMNTPGV
ncbi:peptidase family M48-domain-containing protein [Xylariaceae sp. FL0255]|nr:peptidase family M48-domain-containing protein [Xylariaceae sp. FL0255]